MDVLEVLPVTDFSSFSSKLGDYIDETKEAIRILHPSCDIKVIDKETEKPLFILKKNVIPKEIYEPLVKEYVPIVKKMESSNRGFAAGMKERIQKEKFERSKSIQSAIAGYIDSPNNKYPCRLTKFSRDHFEKYQRGIPFLRIIDTCFKNTLPEQYHRQKEYAEKTKFRIEDTIFTTVTMNYNFQTAIHVDKGDCKEGFGTLVVCSENIHGGDLVFPRYQIGVHIENGDILLMNVHEYHCNTTIMSTKPEGYRLSFVCYLREKLLNCIHNKVLEEIGVPENKHWDTEMIVRKILEKISMKYEERVIEENSWSIENDRYRMVCRKRQYNFYDKSVSKKVQSLYHIWNYVKDIQK